MNIFIRSATTADVPAILEIYNDVICHSTAVYCDEVVTLEERQQWLVQRQRTGFPVIVAEKQGDILGYASFGEFRSHSGYRYTVEHSVHLAAPSRGLGIGTKLVQALLPLAAKMDKHVMVAGVDAANLGSIRFHERLGFSEVGRMPEVGYKFGRWLDLVLLQRKLDR